MRETEPKQSKMLINRRDCRAASPLSLSASPAAPAKSFKAGVFIVLITSPHRKHLEGVVKFFPFKIDQHGIFRHRDGWLLVAVIHATAEAVENFDFTGLFAQNGFSFNELIVLPFVKTSSLARIPRRWLGKKTTGRQILDVIRKWLREKVVKASVVVVFIALLLNALQNNVSPRIEPINAFARISPAPWIAPAILAPSAPPALPPAER